MGARAWWLGLVMGAWACAGPASGDDPPPADAATSEDARARPRDAGEDAGPPGDAAAPRPDATRPDLGPEPDAELAPDDPCAGRADGDWCGGDLGPGAAPGARYRCAGGLTVETSACPAGCRAGACVVAAMDPCDGAEDGDHCGLTLIGGAPDQLYTCAGGRTTGQTGCAHGCQVQPPGTPDTCRPDADPCARAEGDGLWCGEGLGASADSLYTCRGGQTVEAQRCPGGCAAQDGDDACRAGDPCEGANAGNGAYCGSTLGSGAADTLYQCRDRRTSSSQPCPGGCQQNPPGVDDACRAAGDPCARANAGNGAYCGASLGAGDADTLYTCRDGTTVGQAPCPAGCAVMPPGVPDACRALGNPCEAAPVNGLYCGGSLGAGEVDTLYTCRDGGVAASSPCPAGCQQNPPGVPDQCARGEGACCLERPPGALTQAFSACGAGGQHYGVDHGTAVGTPIRAGIAGTVVASRLGLPNCYNNGCTPACWNAFNYVKLRADCGDPDDPGRDLYVWYLHIDDLAPGIRDGSHVDQGQLLAYSGNSGCSSGPHIHLEVASVPRGQNVGVNTCASVDPASRYCR